MNGKIARASYDVKVGDVLELQLGARAVKAEVLSVSEYAKKEEAGRDVPRFRGSRIISALPRIHMSIRKNLI